MSAVVSLAWWNGSAVVTRDLTPADECPRCGAPPNDFACEPHEQIGPTRGYRPAECTLCEVQYALPCEALALRDMQQVNHEKCQQAIKRALLEIERDQADRSRKVRAFFGLDRGELARGLDLVPVQPKRHVVRRALDAFRAAVNAWRGVA